MKECSKSISRRLGDSRFASRYFIGQGIDVGGKPDPLSLYQEFFPLIRSVRTWDLEDGDAQFLDGIADNSFDFLHSSHCLEHLHSPLEGLRNWLRVVKPGGHIVITIPDEDLYEQGVFPSRFNKDHKYTFTIQKERSWSPRSINLFSLFSDVGPYAQVQKVELLDATHRYGLPEYDQTLTPVGECGIEIIMRKRTEAEVVAGGRQPPNSQPDKETRLHLNQYRDDVKTLKSANTTAPPFTNDSDL